MECRAILKGVRLSPQKGRLIADMIRNKPIAEAVDLLTFCPRKGAEIMKKVLESAIANAENNLALDIDTLFVRTVHVEQGQVLRRSRARAKGRNTRINKPTSHVYVTVGD